MSSLFCQKAALAIPILALISSSLLASSVIQLPRYLKRDTCSKGTPSNSIHRCIPFGFAVLFIIITFVFFTLISIPYSLHFVLNLSIIFCIFFLFSATNTASSAHLRFVIFTPPNPIPSTPSMASCIINSLYRLKSIGDITQPCLAPLSTPTSLLTSPSHLTAACCLQYRFMISLLSRPGIQQPSPSSVTTCRASLYQKPSDNQRNIDILFSFSLSFFPVSLSLNSS